MSKTIEKILIKAIDRIIKTDTYVYGKDAEYALCNVVDIAIIAKREVEEARSREQQGI